MGNKKVLCSFISINENYQFGDLLNNTFKNQVLHLTDRSIELSHISDSDDIVLGLFVTTKKTNIPPIHEPGNEDDYSAVDLGVNKGLAYPNIFLYHKQRKICLWESNKLGVSENIMTHFFEQIAINANLTDTNIEVIPVLNNNAYQRIQNMFRIDEIEFQIINPTTYLRESLDNRTLSSVANLADSLGKTSSIKISIKAEEALSLDKNNTTSIGRFFTSISLNPRGRRKNSFKIKGAIDENGRLIEETINYMTDRLTTYFPLEEPIIARHLSIIDRKEGIRNSYLGLREQLDSLFPIP